MFTRFKKLFRRSEPETVRETIEDLIEEIDDLIEENEQKDNSIQADERQLLVNVLDLRDIKAEDLMIPRAELIAAPDTINPDDLIGLMIEHGYSSIPIYHDELDNIIGYIYIKDILAFIHVKKTLNIQHLLKRTLLCISPSMQALDLLLEMRKTGEHIAIVADEHGGTDGMVCFSDIIEEIIGDIQDHAQRVLIQTKEDGTVSIDARASIEEIEETLFCDLSFTPQDDENIETLGGLLVSLVNRVPVRGEIIKHPNGLEFEILDADPRRVKKAAILNYAKKN